MAAKKRDVTVREWWNGLSPARQRATAALAAVEVILTTVALIDLARRPSAQVRGPKAAWILAATVQPFGPIAYLTLGRRTASA
jgi:hypothetical protein